MAQAKEHPIIFSTPMLWAILQGRKTQTRRVIKPQPTRETGDWDRNAEDGEVVIYRGWPTRLCESNGRNKRARGELTPAALKCPYGVPGDRLWIRETWRQPYQPTKYSNGCAYLAEYGYRPDLIPYREAKAAWKWHSSSHMPRWASRLTLEVTNIRVEQLRQISEQDAIAEGYATRATFLAGKWAKAQGNAWVWVVEFRRCEQSSGQILENVDALGGDTPTTSTPNAPREERGQ